MNQSKKKGADEQSKPTRKRPRMDWSLVRTFAVLVVAFPLVKQYKPFAHLFGIESFEDRNGYWLEMLIVATLLGALELAWLFGTHSGRAEFAVVKEDLLAGRIKRMPLAARCAAFLVMITLVSLGHLVREPFGTRLLAVAVPTFLLVALAELLMILQPGDSMLPDPHDELLSFFREQMLKAGFVTAILSLAILYISSLFAPEHLALFIPIALTICLLVPAFVYRRLDRRAESDG